MPSDGQKANVGDMVLEHNGSGYSYRKKSGKLDTPISIDSEQDQCSKKHNGPLQIGEILADRYKIESELGHGNMGYVYKACDSKFERYAAIKVMPWENPSPEAIERFDSEAKTLSKVDTNPHIVRLYDTYEHDNKKFIAMEYVEGPTLRKFMNENPGAPKDSELLKSRLFIFFEVLDAMQYAHDHDVVHRDLKPENIMIEPSGNVKVIDFGLAFFEQSKIGAYDENHSMRCGSDSYMSPEQIGAYSPVDHRTDIFSLGIILYELVTGYHPFIEDGIQNRRQLFDAIFYNEPKPPHEYNPLITQALESVINRMLKKKQKDRIQHVSEVIEELEKALLSEESTSKLSFLNSVRKRILFVVLLVAILLGVGWLMATAEQVNITHEQLAYAAKQGNADAQCALGTHYLFGEGVEKNAGEAVKWYRKAAEQGNANAQYDLGASYYKGQGVNKNTEEAVKWFRKAAEQGSAAAQYVLGACYDSGEGVEKNADEAVKWYCKAAEQGNDAAQYNLGFRYDKGQGVNKNTEEAVKWFRKAAEQGIHEAQYKLCLL